MRVCARVLAAALMTGVIAAALSLPSLLSTGGGEHGALHAPPSVQQRTLRLPELHAPAQHHQQQRHAAKPRVVRHIATDAFAGVRGTRTSRSALLAVNRIATAPRVAPAPLPTPAPRPTEPVASPTPPPAAPAEAAPPPTRELAAAVPPPVVAPVTPPPAQDQDDEDCDDGDHGDHEGHGNGHAFGHDNEDGATAVAEADGGDHGNGHGKDHGK